MHTYMLRRYARAEASLHRIMSSQLPSASPHNALSGTITPPSASQSFSQTTFQRPATPSTLALAAVMASPISVSDCLSHDMSDLSCDTTLLNDSAQSILESPEKSSNNVSHNVTITSAPQTPRRKDTSAHASSSTKSQNAEPTTQSTAAAATKRLVRPDSARGSRLDSARKSTSLAAGKVNLIYTIGATALCSCTTRGRLFVPDLT